MRTCTQAISWVEERGMGRERQLKVLLNRQVAAGL